MSSIEVSFPGGKRVDAQVGNYVIHTDQPASMGGDASAPSPFDLFLASLATCAGIYVLGFLQARSLPTEGVSLVQHVESDAETKLPTRVRIEVRLPAAIPEKYHASIARAAEACKVKKTMASAPEISVAVTA